MLLHEFLERSAERSPDKEALIAGSKRLTFARLDALANQLAHALRSMGVEYTDRVTILLENTAEAVIAIWGILKADAIFQVLNPTTKTQKVAYVLNNCRASVLITHRSKWETAREAIVQTPSPRNASFGSRSSTLRSRGDQSRDAAALPNRWRTTSSSDADPPRSEMNSVARRRRYS